MISIFRKLAPLVFLLVLVSCGGGGDDSDDGNSTATASWTMDAHLYLDGGYSSVSTTTLGSDLVTVAVVSTATLDGGDTGNGPYSGSSLSFTFIGTGAGDYQVVPTTAAFLTADPTTLPMRVQSSVGIAVTTGSSQYTATSGRVRVSIDGTGHYHFTSLGTLPTTKTLDVLGGVAGAPQSMTLNIFDAG